MIRPGSLVLVESSDGEQRYTFALKSPDGKRQRLFERMRGELVVVEDERGPWIKMARAWNVDTVSPVFGVRLNQAEAEFHFASLDGKVLPASAEARLVGRAFLIKEVDWQAEVTISELQAIDH